MTRPIPCSRTSKQKPSEGSGWALLGPLAGLLIAAPVQAQELADPETTAGQTPLVLDPVTVTARRAQEDVRDIPFSVTVVNGEEIEDRGMLSPEDLLRDTPGVSVNTSGGANVSSIYIRGTGPLYPMSMDDATVAVNLDGSPLTARHLSLGTLDIDRIEVLKGPQGTLFGGLGGAGAVNVYTRRPTRHFEGYVRGEFGQEGQHAIAAAVGGPISEAFSGRLAARYSGYDYPITNVQNGEPVSEPDNVAARGILRWDLSPDTSAEASMEYQDSRHMGENLVLMPYGDEPKMDVTPGIYDYSHKTLYRGSLEVTHDFDTMTLTSQSTYTDVHNLSPVVFDRMIYRAMGMGEGEYWRDQDSKESVFTQDLHLSSLPDSSISWVAGISALYSDRSYDHSRQGGLFGVIPGFSQMRDFTTQRYGVYGEVTVPVMEDLKATAGLRHTYDRKTYDAAYTQGGVVTNDTDEMDDNFTTGRLGLTYALTPEANVYATVARGYNPGGFQDYAEYPGDAAYEAGTIYSGETGIKAEFLGRRLRMDASLFYTYVKDNYLLDSNGVASYILNADTRSMGGEVAASWRMTEDLTLSGSLTYTHARILSDVDAQMGGPVESGNHVPDVPEWSGTLAAIYSTALPNIGVLSSPRLNARVDYTYVGERPADVQNHFDLEAYHKVDTRLGVAAGGGELYVWGRNLLDDHYDLYGFYDEPTNVKYGAPARGRTFGVGFNLVF